MKKYTLKMQLEKTELCRIVSICGGMTFADLHQVIQIVFGWEDYHLHCFRVGKLVIGNYEDYEEDDLPMDFRWEGELKIDLILLNTEKVFYTYDDGDGWHISIMVEEIENVDDFECPKLLEVYGGMAQEACGGVDALMCLDREEVDIDGLNLILEYTFE